MALFCAAVWRDSVSLLKFPFFFKPCLGLLMWDFVCLSLIIYTQLFFFPFLFYNYCCSVGSCVICAVSSRCNQSFFVHFYEVFKSSYRYIDAIFNAGNPSSHFIFWYSLSVSRLEGKALCIVFRFLILWSICWSSSYVVNSISLQTVFI